MRPTVKTPKSTALSSVYLFSMLGSYRLLAIDPCCKGFGFVLFDVPSGLADHGLVRVTKDKATATILRFEEFLVRCRPDALVLENTHAPGSRRWPRIVKLLEDMRQVANDQGIAVYQASRLEVCAHFQATKYKIALQLVRTYPVLAGRLPPPRRIWQSENDRLAIFDAQALVVTCLGFIRQSAGKRQVPEDYVKSRLTPTERLVY